MAIPDDDVDEELIDVATSLINNKSEPFDENRFTDKYTIALRNLIKKQTGNKSSKELITADDDYDKSSTNVIDLMVILKKSLEIAETVNFISKREGSQKSKITARKRKRKA